MKMFLGRLQAFLSPKPSGDADARNARETENRRATRRPQRMRDGFITCPAKPAFPPLACRIRDVSMTGARIEVVDDLPDPALWATGVRLYFATDNHEIQCRMAWRKGRSMGLHFQGVPQAPSRAYR